MLNKSIIKIRVELQKAQLKKSGKNKYAGFEYFELADFLPKLNELMLAEEINDRFFIKDGQATLELIKGEEKQEYTIPFVLFDTPLNKQGQASMQDIQYLGALNTYYKRYLYLNAFGITDGDVIDSMNNEEITTKPENIMERKATPKQIEMIKNLIPEQDKLLEFYKIEKVEDLTLAQASEIIKKKGNK